MAELTLISSSQRPLQPLVEGALQNELRLQITIALDFVGRLGAGIFVQPRRDGVVCKLRLVLNDRRIQGCLGDAPVVPHEHFNNDR